MRLAGVAHFDRPLDAKAAAKCTVDARCSTGDAALDAAIAVRKKSIARISYVDAGRAFVCTGTLLDTEKFPAPYFLTANHCIGRAQVASSITSLWFFEADGCGSAVWDPGRKQVAGGMAIDFADPNTDHTLLVMNASPPSGTTFSGWNAAKLSQGASVVSLSHPAGDVPKWALATVSGVARFPDWEQAAWLTTFYGTAFAFLDSADLICMSVLPEMIGLRNTRLMFDQLLARGYPEDKIWLILNRLGLPGGFSQPVLEEWLGRTLRYTIPNDQELATDTINRGVPFVRSHQRSSVAKASVGLARELVQALAAGTEAVGPASVAIAAGSEALPPKRRIGFLKPALGSLIGVLIVLLLAWTVFPSVTSRAPR